MIIAEIIVYAVGIYLAVGVVFGAWLVLFGVAKFDEVAKETSLGFRLIIFFGAAALWVLLVWRLVKRNDLQNS